MPKPYTGLIDAWREIIPAVLRQVRDPGYYVQRTLPYSDPCERRGICNACDHCQG